MDKALSLLALARKGGIAELGEEPVGGAARGGKAYVILVAKDASDHTWRRAKSFAAGTEQQCVRLPWTKDQLGAAIGRDTLPPLRMSRWPWPWWPPCPRRKAINPRWRC